MDQFSRTRMAIGDKAQEALFKCRVAVFGLGGVGGHAFESLVRAGVGSIDLIDNAKITLTNLNRQIIATHKTIGQWKAEAAKQRAIEINPNCKANAVIEAVGFETIENFDFSKYDYVIDCVDTVSAKIAIIMKAKSEGAGIISCMGAGNKTNPALLKVADIYKTNICPLAKVMRRELRKRGVESLKTIYSEEEPKAMESWDTEEEPLPGKHQIPASTPFVPACAGLIAASEAVMDLARESEKPGWQPRGEGGQGAL